MRRAEIAACSDSAVAGAGQILYCAPETSTRSIPIVSGKHMVRYNWLQEEKQDSTRMASILTCRSAQLLQNVDPARSYSEGGDSGCASTSLVRPYQAASTGIWRACSDRDRVACSCETMQTRYALAANSLFSSCRRFRTVAVLTVAV